MIVIDTNVISEITKPRPDDKVLKWFAASSPPELYLCNVTVMELEFGAERYLIKYGSLKYQLFVTGLIDSRFRDRILDLDRDAFANAGRLRARREMSGRMISVQDAMIAAICLQHGATLATRNTKDFEGLDLKLANPFEGA
jgi:toxin FitB